MFPDFFGNAHTAAALDALTRERRMPQTILLDGPEGIGKATLARRFGAALLGGGNKIEQDDLSLPANKATIACLKRLVSGGARSEWPTIRSKPNWPLQTIARLASG